MPRVEFARTLSSATDGAIVPMTTTGTLAESSSSMTAGVMRNGLMIKPSA